MKNLINNILEHRTESNKDYLDYLVDIIKDNEINTIDELDKYESINDIDRKLLNAYNVVKKDLYKYDSLNYAESLELGKLMDEYLNYDTNEKIKSVIKMYKILSLEPIFYKESYNLIINNQL